jgi:CheY-like chemotaxis protein
MGIPLLGDALHDDSRQPIIKSMERCVARGAGLVRQILTFARGGENENVPLELGSAAKELGKVVSQSFPKNIQIETDIPADLSRITGNATQIYQILMNLAVNARDAMPDGGTLAISARNSRVDESLAREHAGACTGPHVVLAVRDTDTGMAPEILARLGEPFFTTKPEGRGTGLGFAVTKSIVEKHGGFLEIETAPGKGSEFRVYLPVTNSASGEVAHAPRPLARGNGELVLVVDDEETVLQMMRATLEAHGYRVITAMDGIEAIVQFSRRSGEIRAVVTDLLMPNMGGVMAIRTLRKLDPEVRVIACSGVVAAGESGSAPGVGERAFLRKPFTVHALLSTLQDVLATPVQL